ncbi:hypothetical protein E4U43_004712 [Claviceps pusilla]|uniref:Protein kinase domain-containing protein n=1 Tax=Claviceps pusilla TaxID=123648 RepID=A0A9P7N310_9HYPO|nr:hypothetical protein E4U43_004712 [Claviceps pusilla]
MSSTGASRPNASLCHGEQRNSEQRNKEQPNCEQLNGEQLNNSTHNHSDHGNHVSNFSAKCPNTNTDAAPQVPYESETVPSSTLTSRLTSPQPSVKEHDYSSPLRISNNISTPIPISSVTRTREAHPANVGLSPPRTLSHNASSGNLLPLSRTPSLKAAFANCSGPVGNPGSSTFSSPVITALGDMTPLPSPLLSGDSPGPWKSLGESSTSPSQSSDVPMIHGPQTTVAEVLDNNKSTESVSTVASSTRRKNYGALDADNRTVASTLSPQHAAPSICAHQSKDRSVSEYVPDTTSQPHKRNIVVSSSHVDNKLSAEGQESLMRREINFAESRGITSTVVQLLTPPSSESSKDLSAETLSKDGGDEWFEACGQRDKKRRRWRSIGFLGQGTFSRVMLASSQTMPGDLKSNYGQPIESTSALLTEEKRRRKLVAVKVCEHGPRGGASEERIEMSLKRELEIMQDIHHPSLVNLKAWSIEPTRAILVLSYCPGGDLFDIATTQRKLITPAILRRIFAEMVGAVKYLHEKNIVHRDIKLENVLVNLTPPELAAAVDWTTFPTSVITLADLGLSRRITDDEKLETRCGSDDYAAPEVIMGQPYDGRATDAWSLGVLLYALLESRLPFDPHPGMSDAHRMRSRTSHRIARVEWRWVEFGGEDGDHEASEAKFKEQGLLGAMEITEGLLKRARSRWTVDKVANHPWVCDAIHVEGGIRFRDEDDGEDI